MALNRFLIFPLALALNHLAGAKSYEFRVNGKPVEAESFSLTGAPEAPAPGDVARILGFSFVLEAPERYELRQRDKDRQRLFRVMADGTETLVACRIAEDSSVHTGKGKERVYINPLD